MNSKPTVNRIQLTTSSFDKVHGFLVAAIFVCSFVAVVLFGIWYGNEYQAASDHTFKPPRPEPTRTGISTPVQVFDSREFTNAAGEHRFESDMFSVSQAVANVSAKYGERARGKKSEIGIFEIRELPPAKTQSIQKFSLNLKIESFEEFKHLLHETRIEIGLVHATDNRIVRLGNSKAPNFFEAKITSREQESNSGSFWFGQTNRLARWSREIGKSVGFEFPGQLYVLFVSTPEKEKLFELAQHIAKRDGHRFDDIARVAYRCQRDEKGNYGFVVSKVDYR